MSKYKVVIPPESIAKSFTFPIEIIVDQMILFIHQFHTLAALRDSLLPKLISGEIRVRDAERFLAKQGL